VTAQHQPPERASARAAPPAGWEQRPLETAADAVLVVDACGQITWLNPAAEDLFGHGRSVAAGKPLAALVTAPDVRGARWTALVRSAAGDPGPILDRRFEARALRADGAERPVELTVTPIDDAPARFAVLVRERPEPSPADRRASRMQHLLAAAEQLAHLGSWEIDLRTRAVMWSDEMYRIHGYEPGGFEPRFDLLGDMVVPEDREALGALMRAVTERPEQLPDDGVAIQYRTGRADGSIRDVRAHGRIERDPGGAPTHFVGFAQDVTDQLLTERELHAHYVLEQALREWETSEDGVMGLLRRLGTALDFAMGGLWIPCEGGAVLACRAFWTAPDVDAADFEAATRSMTFRPGESGPGQAWATQQPVISSDLELIPRLGRDKEAARLGLRSGLAFPAVADDGAVAVLTYYSFDRRIPSERLVRTLTGIGRELGRFLARRRADLGIRSPSQRELEVLRLAAEGNTGPQIAERLFVSPATVKTHFENLYEKLGVSDRAAAVAYALRNGLIR
jgi:PAS domain S-box-containing protein